MSAEATPFDGSDDENALEPPAMGRWISDVQEATYVLSAGTANPKGDRVSQPEDLSSSVGLGSKNQNHQGQTLPQLLDAFFAQAAAAQRAEEDGDLSAAVACYSSALASLASAIPLQDAAGAAGGGDPRTAALLRTKYGEYSARYDAARLALEKQQQAAVVSQAVNTLAASEAVKAMAITDAANDATNAAASDAATRNPTIDDSATEAARVAELEAESAALAASGRQALADALEMDEAKRSEDALPLYIQAADSYLAAIAALNLLQSLQSPTAVKVTGASTGGAASASAAAERHKASITALRAQAVQVLDRIEAIKRGALLEENEIVEKSHPPSSVAAAVDASADAVQKLGDALLPPAVPQLPSSSSSSPLKPPIAPLAVAGGSSSSHGRHLNSSSASSSTRLTPAEIDVLRRTSRIHGKLFLPWGSDDPKAERFSYADPWNDPEGLLPLSKKQQAALGSWRRPHEFASSPVMIANVSPLVITQDLVGDCSFVASLCITAAFERRFKRRLITGIIWPQNSSGMPVYNPSGKYLVKLWANGCERRVVVDDRFPCDKSGSLMTCYSNNRRELWVSVIEKAYMKLHGGYDFPGSNSGVDLYSLTGWIPESVNLNDNDDDDSSASKSSSNNSSAGSPVLPSDRVWKRLESAHRFGDCLLTLATGPLDEAEADRAGLVPTHAYAVLDAREVPAHLANLATPPSSASGSGNGSGSGNNNTLRLLLVKNPWAKKRWRGNFSAHDERHWTPALQLMLNYDVALARTCDNGVFWIDWASATHYFRVLHLNWNPSLFQHKAGLHQHWPVSQGPQNDSYNYGYNPQFTLKIAQPPWIPSPSIAAPSNASSSSSSSGGTVWILLTRHVVAKDDDSDHADAHDARGGGSGRGIGTTNAASAAGEDGKDYLTCHVFENTLGQRVFAPGSARKSQIVQGVYSNNQHALVRFELPSPPSVASANKSNGSGSGSGGAGATREYTLVVSQYCKVRAVDFTLQAWCTTAPLALTPAPSLPPHGKEFRGSWDATSCGGALGHPSFYTNPMWSVTVASPSNRFHAELMAPKELYVGLRLVRSSGGRRIDTIGSPSSSSSDDGGPIEEASSGPYTPGFAHVAVNHLPVGTYTLVATTFSPGERGAFVLKCYSGPAPLQRMQPIPPEGDGMACTKLRGRWDEGSTAAGCTNYQRYDCNPIYRIVCSARSTLVVRLMAAAVTPPPGGGSSASRNAPALNLALFPFTAGAPISSGNASALGLPPGASPSLPSAGGRPATCCATTHQGVYTAAGCGVSLGPVALEAGTYLAVPSTFEPWVGDFSLAVHTHPTGCSQVSRVQ